MQSVNFVSKTNAWEQWKLSDLAYKINRFNANESVKIPLTVSAQHGLVAQLSFFKNQVMGKNISKYQVIHKGEFSYNKSPSEGFPFGVVRRLNNYEKGLLSPVYVIFGVHEDKVNSDFLSIIFNTYEWNKNLAPNIKKGARILLNISDNDFFNVNLTAPSTQVEQENIAKLIYKLDSLITLHQRKFLNLKNLKSRLLDIMFCDEKSQFPSIRFKEFTNAWEQWKVGDLITERIEFTKESNEFPLMAFVANEGVVAKGERYDRSSLVRDIYNKIYKVTKYGDFIYSSNNLDRGSIGANKYGNACISPVYSIFKCTNSSDHNFIKNILSRHSFVNKLLKYRQGVVYGQLKIHESIFLNINLNSPSILEQNKIGKIFYNLDSLITLHQRG
ncbi:restriction endonuclease subunit S [Mycoplasmopsis bovis]|uniref:restriction endonuclease subunit S n=1 Tax=Mycoplasmopsis bovis TaxID=28903 RepID=UPI00296A5DF0|nr:restriction endonuclease subunit S [Mycoplasmopsis bovis]